MKVTINEKSKEIEYPCLMIAKETKRVVLFYEEGSGVLLHGGITHLYIGNIRQSFDMDIFEIFNGTVTLEN